MELSHSPRSSSGLQSLKPLTHPTESPLHLNKSTFPHTCRKDTNFEVFSAPQFIAALLDQMPPKGVPQVRYYGRYSNKSHGLRQRTAGAAAGTIHAPPARPRRRRTAWRELLQQVWGVDPLKCPLCSGLLRPIAVVETKAEILAVLVPLGLFRPHDHPFAVGPPRPEVAVLIDAATGDCHALDPPDFPPGLPYPQPRDEPKSWSRANRSTKRALSCPCHRKSRRRTPGRAHCSATTIPSLIPPTPSRFSGARAAGRPRQTTTSFKPTQRNQFEASLLESEQPEACLFASCLP